MIVNSLCSLWVTGAVWALGPGDDFKVKPLEKLSSREISDWGAWALGINASKWQHGETEHFIIHFTRSGDKVARRSEMFYQEIRSFFGNRPDLMPTTKSHVFAFSEADDWSQFAGKIDQSWAVGVTRGKEFFYHFGEEARHGPGKAKVTAHEMTHLMFNRFFRGRLPLWLNEGIAEYFGQRSTSTVTEFRRQMGVTVPYPLTELFEAQAYPQGRDRIQSFYAESAILVDFLTKTQDRQTLLPKFVDAMLKGGELDAALKVYGYPNRAEFLKEYQKYRRHF
jgi:hypothetical protein